MLQIQKELARQMDSMPTGRLIESTDIGATALSFSADGTWLAFVVPYQGFALLALGRWRQTSCARRCRRCPVGRILTDRRAAADREQ
jgi:hypothetical protein